MVPNTSTGPEDINTHIEGVKYMYDAMRRLLHLPSQEELGKMNDAEEKQMWVDIEARIGTVRGAIGAVPGLADILELQYKDAKKPVSPKSSKSGASLSDVATERADTLLK